ncbi:MAG: SRPBCC domain-containing protein [Oligoflexia bacterium]
MIEIETGILIDRSTDVVWRELTNLPMHPEWNPFIKSISGNLAVGEKLNVHIQPPNQSRSMKFSPRILKFEAAKEFSWKGHLLIPGLFDGEHFFRLEAVSPSQTRFVHGEKFTGILVPVLKGMLGETKMGFELMNQALKKRVEKT